MKKYSIIILLTSLSLSHVLAQRGTIPLLRYDNLLWISPNIESSNAAALSTLSLDFPEFTSSSDAKLIFNYDQGTLGNPQTPESTRDIMFSTKSVQRFENTFVSAYFDYRFQRLEHVQWHNLMNPGSHAVAISDSIPGSFNSESFFTGVKVGHKLNDHHTIGIGVNYNIGTGAKNIDLRNLNRKVYVDISPSWMFQQEWGNIGVDVGFHRSIEDMEYRQVVTQGPQTIFRMEGLWFFSREDFSGTVGRFFQDQGFKANLKLDLKSGQMMWYNQIGVNYTNGFQKLRSTITNEQFGDQQRLAYLYGSTLVINPQHQIRANFQNSTLLTYRLLQRNEFNPATRAWAYVTYARTNHYSEVQNAADLTYAYANLRNGNPMDQVWRVEIGGAYFQRVQAQRIFPYLFQQTANVYEGFASFNKNIPTRSLIIDVKPQFSFSTGGGTLNERFDLDPNPSILPNDGWQFLPQLKHEFNYLTGSKFGVGLEANVAYPFGRTNRTALFLNARISHREALNTDLKGFSRTYMSIHLGFNF